MLICFTGVVGLTFGGSHEDKKQETLTYGWFILGIVGAFAVSWI